MTKEEVIALAHKAGLHLATDVHWMPIIDLAYAEKFAALVAAHTREECAALCEEYDDGRFANAADLCAAAIRSRT